MERFFDDRYINKIHIPISAINQPKTLNLQQTIPIDFALIGVSRLNVAGIVTEKQAAMIEPVNKPC